MIDEILTAAGQQWRAAQRPPAPPRLRPDGTPQRGFATTRRWAAPRLWAPVAAVACVLAVIAGVALPLVLRSGTPPSGLGSTGAGPTSSPSGSPTAPALATLPPDDGSGVAVTGTGYLLREKSGQTKLCAQLMGDSFLDNRVPAPAPMELACGPIAVPVTSAPTGILAHPTTHGQRYSDLVSVTGTYHNGVLAISTAAAARVTPTVSGDNDVTSGPCPAPSGGWPHGYGGSDGDSNAMIEYVRSHEAEFTDVWEAHPDGISGPSYQPVTMVLVVGTTGDVDAARAKLSALYPGNLCVYQARYNAAQLTQIAERLTSVDSTPIAATADPTADRVRVSVVALDAQTMSVVNGIGGDAVIFEPPLLLPVGR